MKNVALTHCAAQDVEDRIGVRGQRAVVEGQNHLVIVQRQRLVVLHGPDAGMLRRVDHDGAGRAERIRIGAIGGICPHRHETGGRDQTTQQQEGGSFHGLICGTSRGKPSWREAIVLSAMPVNSGLIA